MARKSVNYSNSANGWDVTIYWDSEYGDSEVYMTWSINKNSYGRTFGVVYGDETGSSPYPYQSGSWLAANEEYYLYVYKNGYYSQHAGPFTMSTPSTPPAPKEYTVSYNANGGSNAPSSQIKYADSTLYLTTSKPNPPASSSSPTYFNITGYDNFGSNLSHTIQATKTTGTTYSFINWNTSSSGNGTSYNSGGAYTSNSNVTLYAQWQSNTGTTYSNNTLVGLIASARPNSAETKIAITLNSNGGNTVNPVYSTYKYTYRFNHWNSNAAGTGTKYTSNSSFTSSASVYAQWDSSLVQTPAKLPIPTKNGTVTEYTITYSGNGGTPLSPYDTIRRTTFYEFKNWNTASNGSGTIYKDSITTMNPITLYAQWNVSSSSVDYIILTRAVRQGYKFLGWSANPSATTPEYPAGYLFDEERNVTLYAVWEKEPEKPTDPTDPDIPPIIIPPEENLGPFKKMAPTIRILDSQIKYKAIIYGTDGVYHRYKPIICMDKIDAPAILNKAILNKTILGMTLIDE